MTTSNEKMIAAIRAQLSDIAARGFPTAACYIGEIAKRFERLIAESEVGRPATWCAPSGAATKRPTEEQFERAIMWLHVNDGADGEADACSAVADWIEQCRTSHMLRETAREAGVSVAELRKRLARGR